MKKKAIILAVLLLAAGGMAFAARRQFVGAEPDEVKDDFYNVVPFAGDVSAWLGEIETAVEQLNFETEVNTMPLPAPPYLPAQISAMLQAIKKAEGTADRGDPYRVCYSYRHTINSFADHPAVTREWAGERLSDAMCADAGLGPGCVSTAAGAYQIIRPTWLRLKTKLGLPDFSPASQDAAATELLRERGALARLEVGDFAGAVEKTRKEWASLPGAGYGQGERSIAWLTARFTEAGGVLA